MNLKSRLSTNVDENFRVIDPIGVAPFEKWLEPRPANYIAPDYMYTGSIDKEAMRVTQPRVF